MNNKIIPWPAFIIALALAFATFTWWSLTQAASRVSAVTDSGYYSHGLTYNSTSHELLAAEAMGWKIRPQVAGRHLTIRIEDAQQEGVPGLQGLLTLQAEAAKQKVLPLNDAGLGRYTIDLPAGLPAILNANLTLSKEQASLQRRLLIALGR